MAAMTLCRKRHSPPSRDTFLEELCPNKPLELRRPSSPSTAGPAAMRGVYLADASNSGKDTLRYSFFGGCKINVDSDKAGIGRHLEWVWPVARIALFERRDPQDPQYPRLKPVGVYLVIDGWAHINLEEVAGKGQDFYNPLYIAPGTALMKQLGFGLERRLNSLNFVKAT